MVANSQPSLSRKELVVEYEVYIQALNEGGSILEKAFVSRADAEKYITTKAEEEAKVEDGPKPTRRLFQRNVETTHILLG